ncbi:parathyroid hormone-related protein-like [Paramormyrops kingsleyae]|uniref:parathyroid hormone-related protein-like n=1 Tax=Paramormyrops kingsleyae TaxID=1676925 RepID=UPI000CD651E1|nr:parathyroid hormone-related protein-like [Paramormyrops kingsleyae]XP_023671061.1 parathyroid hormone-related protein-like [Paramormyrops kingsleyae]XP_023671062.1 parathyroid hormone-related protein-like [Paramormyrops kingsleyae]
MFCSRRLFQQWSFAVFLLCTPVPYYGRHIDALTNRTRRSVSHAQLMHDKGRTLQDFKRHMWLQKLLDEVHTAETREPLGRSTPGGTVGGTTGGTGGGSLHPKPSGSTKNYPMGFPQEEEGTNLPQETNKSASKGASKKKKKGRAGKRRDTEKKRRRTRSVLGPGSGWPLDWRRSFKLPKKLH